MTAQSDTAQTVQAALQDLCPDYVHFACAPVADHTDRLFPAESRAIAKAIDVRRNDFSTGRVLARDLMGQMNVDPVAIPADERRSPCWPDGVVGSISHSKGLCVVAMARSEDCAALGVDIERTTDIPQNILPAIAPAEEISALRDCMPHDILTAVLFSTREAVYKAYNPVTDAFLGHRDVTMTLEDGRFVATIHAADRPRFLGQDQVKGRFDCVSDMVLSLVAYPA